MNFRGGGATKKHLLKGNFLGLILNLLNSKSLVFNIKKYAFTMAEVLITLGIIGIVVAMTLPSVIGKYQKKVTAEKLKKFYSVITNAAKLSEYENGDMYYWEFPKQGYDPEIKNFFRRYYLPYLKDAKEYDKHANWANIENYSIRGINGNIQSGGFLASYLVKTNDGMYIYFLPNTPAGYIWMYVDINGHQKPNQIGYDIFVFDIYGYPYISNPKNYKIKFWGHYLKDEDLVKPNNYGCIKTSPQYSGFNCGELIMRNGWEIPDNYPW